MDNQVLGMCAHHEALRADRAQDRYLTDIGLYRDGSLIDPERLLRRIAPPPSAWTALGAVLVAMVRRPWAFESAE